MTGGTGRALLVGTNKFAVVAPLLARAGEIRTTVLTEPWYAEQYRRRGVTDVHTVPNIADLTAVTATVAELMREQDFTAVLAPSERGLPTAGLLRSRFDIPGMRYDVAVGFTAKHVMKSRLRDAGLPVAPMRVARNREQLLAAVTELGAPVIVKPSLGTAGGGTVTLRTPNELRDFLLDGGAGREGGECGEQRGTARRTRWTVQESP